MKAKKSIDYRKNLLESLLDPDEASAYLEESLSTGDSEVFLLALRDVSEAYGVSRLSRKTRLNRQNIYKMLSSNGNPRLESLEAILGAMNLRLSVQRKSA